MRCKQHEEMTCGPQLVCCCLSGYYYVEPYVHISIKLHITGCIIGDSINIQIQDNTYLFCMQGSTRVSLGVGANWFEICSRVGHAR